MSSGPIGALAFDGAGDDAEESGEDVLWRAFRLQQVAHRVCGDPITPGGQLVGQHASLDFAVHRSGGLPVVVRELAENGPPHAGAITVTGSGAGANAADAPCWNREVIKTAAEPFQPAGTGTGVLRGNLAPGGAVIEQSASSPHLLKHRGRALVFDSPADYYATSNDHDLDADEDTVLVIRYCGPRGYPACRRRPT